MDNAKIICGERGHFQLLQVPELFVSSRRRSHRPRFLDWKSSPASGLVGLLPSVSVMLPCISIVFCEINQWDELTSKYKWYKIKSYVPEGFCNYLRLSR
jgi:hypothetical protein